MLNTNNRIKLSHIKLEIFTQKQKKDAKMGKIFTWGEVTLFLWEFWWA